MIVLYSDDLLYQVALTLVPHIGPVHGRQLIEHFGEAREVFKARTSALIQIPGLGSAKAQYIRQFRDFRRAEQEIHFMERNDIIPLLFRDTGYPRRLLECYDPPVLLYSKGHTDLNTKRVIAVIGTRHPTAYGRNMTEQLISDLSSENVLVVSGLAYGIDATAHKAALKNKLGTVGVLAHGIDRVYPDAHNQLAREMMQGNGMLISEFISGTQPDRHNFPIRNRIVAGMSDVTIVVETAITGGSMITAELANNYNREVFAFPGRTNDAKSVGCNRLIHTNRAVIFTDIKAMTDHLGWNDPQPKKPRQPVLFKDPTPDEAIVINLLKDHPSLHIDLLSEHSALGSSVLAATILSLELQNMVVSLPGKRYRLA